MRCNNCYTHLPDFGRFERKICPNCGMPIAERIPSVSKRKHTDDLGVVAIQDRTLLCLLASMAFVLLLLSCSVTVELWEYFVLLIPICLIGAIVAAVLFVINLIHSISIRAQIPHHLRDPFGRDILMALIFGSLSLISFIIVAAGIYQSVYYNENQDKFVQVQAVISEIEVETDDDGDKTHKVYISYSFGNHDYENVRYRSYNSSMHVGDKLNVTIDPSDPDDFPSKGTEMIIVGSVTLAVFSFLLLFKVLKPIIKRRYA